MFLSSSDFSASAAGTGSQVNFPSIISGFMMAEQGHEIHKGRAYLRSGNGIQEWFDGDLIQELVK